MEDYNNTSFAVTITSHFLALADDPILKSHQQIVLDYMKDHNGILVQHDLGTGKSLIAASILASLVETSQVIFLSAKTLHGNMKKTIQEFENQRGAIKKNYTFVTLNASNMLHQMEQATSNELSLDKKFHATGKLNLNDKVLIIDEAHNLFNSITNGSQNAMGLYNGIMKAKNLKVIFLTGTPIINHPFELVPCFNMIGRKEILPVGWDDFNRFFVSMKDKKIKNRAKFQNRISGLISYYGIYYSKGVDPLSIFTKIVKKPDFPDRHPVTIIKVPMSSYQMRVYSNARDVEIQESSFGQSTGVALQKPKGIFTTSYKRLSRQFSNIAFPQRAMTIEGRKMTLHSDKVEDDDLSNLAKFSPKWDAMLKSINNTKGKALVYSSFVENAGINMFAKALILQNWKDYTKSSGGYSDDVLSKFISGGKSQGSFIRITGDVPPEDRQPLIDKFNDVENANGSIIRLIMISSAGAEGLDLKGVRHVHIMEPYWNWMRLEQVIGRAIRYKSHVQLVEKDRDVHINIYASDYPTTIDKDNVLFANEKTTDMLLLDDSRSLHEINYQFYIAMAEASIDCGTHNKNSALHCRLCAPTNVKLYEEDISKDMAIRSPCKPLNKEKVSANEILVDDKKYAWYKTENTYTILEWREDLAGYIELTRDDPNYPIIYEKIIK